MSELDQNQRLAVAARIKAIADSSDTFDARLAEEIAEALEGAPVHRFSFDFRSSFRGGGTSGHSPGVGDVTVPEDEKTVSFSANDRTVRCGAYVIEKVGKREFDIRHVMEIDADEVAPTSSRRSGNASSISGT